MRSRTPLLTVLLAILSGASAFAAPRDAAACQPPPCDVASVAPADAVTIPSTVLALPYLPSRNLLGPDAGAQTFELFDSSKAIVATTTQADAAWGGKGQLLVPAAPLTEGQSYTLSYEETCGPTPKAVANTFTIGAPAPLPKTAGALSPGARKAGSMQFPASDGSCSGTATGVTVPVHLEVSSELLPFLPVTSFTVSVDGSASRRVYYGAALREGNTAVVTTYSALCEEVDNLTGDLLPGKHTVAVRAHVAGATTDPPELTTTIDLRCDEGPVDTDGGTVRPDGGTTKPDGGDTSKGSDGGTDPTHDVEDDEQGDDSGCSVSTLGHSSQSTAFGGAGLLSLGLALVLRQRASRRRHRA